MQCIVIDEYAGPCTIPRETSRISCFMYLRTSKQSSVQPVVYFSSPCALGACASSTMLYTVPEKQQRGFIED